ncbi:MAG: polysaccharide biosynthesis protein [Actinomycetaceae bacterium]|nr:polysaccharide biosynthesis protein [Actinomycetaceae bacterium]
MDLASLKNERILITGAGGSVGAQLARQLFAMGCKQLILLDRDGSHLHALELSLLGTGLLSDERFVLADIRDEAALREIFDKHVPSVIIHAAALKHVPLLERFPAEAWKTNVLGTVNLLNLANSFNVGTFIHISTDKAADPVTVLGKSKHLAEQLVVVAGQGEFYFLSESGQRIRLKHPEDDFSEDARHNFSSDSRYLSKTPRRYVNVRFGNVVGSRGSVSETFKYQVSKGIPLTVTTADAKRFLMSLEDACELILLSLQAAENTQTVVLKMGEEVSVVDFARQVMAQVGNDVPLNFIGARIGDKTSEVLIGVDEEVVCETQQCWFLQGRTLNVERLSWQEALGNEEVMQ